MESISTEHQLENLDYLAYRFEPPSLDLHHTQLNSKRIQLKLVFVVITPDLKITLYTVKVPRGLGNSKLRPMIRDLEQDIAQMYDGHCERISLVLISDKPGAWRDSFNLPISGYVYE